MMCCKKSLNFYWEMSHHVMVICKEMSRLHLKFINILLHFPHLRSSEVYHKSYANKNSTVRMHRVRVIINLSLHYQTYIKNALIRAHPLLYLQNMSTFFQHSRVCIKIPFNKMWPSIFGGGSYLAYTYSIKSQSHPFKSSPSCHYVPPRRFSCLTSACGLYTPATVSCFMQKHVKAWQKIWCESHFMSSLREM